MPLGASFFFFFSRVQELCESRRGRPGLSVLMSLTVSIDVKQHRTMLRYWSQFVPNVSTDIRGHEALHHHHPFLEGVPLVEFVYLVFTRIPDERYRRRLRSSLSC